MRTKTLLLIAAAVAAGAGTSMAQVYSVNAVGYVNKTIPANGFALIANPLTAATNTVNALFQPVPVGFQVFVYVPGTGFQIGTYDDLEGAFVPDSVGNTVINPGQGVFAKNPTANPVTITFVGEVPQGTLTTPLVAGLQIVASQVPQAGTPSVLGLPSTTTGGASPGDQIYQFNTTTQKYAISTFDDLAGTDGAFVPDPASLDVGDAIFLKRVKAGTWTRTFNVNSP